MDSEPSLMVRPRLLWDASSAELKLRVIRPSFIFVSMIADLQRQYAGVVSARPLNEHGLRVIAVPMPRTSR